MVDDNEILVDGPVRGWDNNDLSTPEHIWRPALEMTQSDRCFGLDPCTNARSTVPAQVKIDRDLGGDGLSDRWVHLYRSGIAPLRGNLVPITVWHNPVYSNPKPWCSRAIEAYDDGMEVFSLLKLDPSTEWSRIMRSRPRAECDFHKRIRFDGGKFASGAMASRLWYMGPNPYLFCHHFSSLGEVRIIGR